MSMMLCYICDRMVDTDVDYDSLYTIEYPDECVCEYCRDTLGLELDI